MRRTMGLAVGGLVFAVAALAHAQSSQIKPRVMVMVDTSGSMTSHLIDGTDTGSDQSTAYSDGVLTPAHTTPYAMYAGYATANQCSLTQPTYDPNTSRMFNAKAAVTNVVNGSGDVDWGLMRYSGSYCAFDQTLAPDPSAMPKFNSDVWPNANPRPTGAQPAVCTNGGATACPNGETCNTTTGKCLCNANAQCGSNRCNTVTGECLITVVTQCASGTGTVSSGQCLCTADAQCTSGKCNVATGMCQCTAANQCRSNSCNLTTGWCNCTNDNQCLGGGNAGTSFGGTCFGGFCGCSANSSCQSNSCNGYTARCNCSAAGQCASGTCDATSGSCTCTAGTAATVCHSGACDGSGNCTCTNDWQCPANEFCISGICQRDNNLCNAFSYGETTTREGGLCRSLYTAPTTYQGGCGTVITNASSTTCQSHQVCYADSDCSPGNAGQCVLDSSGKFGQCSCGAGGNVCPANYTCTGNRCVYNQDCVDVDGGKIVVDPVSAQSAKLLKWVDGVEVFTDDGTGSGDATNPELRAVGSTPLAATARVATDWYKNTVDTLKSCRPYVLVQITDGDDTCEPNTNGDRNTGPVAAASGFVAATVPGAQNPNKVYVIGLNISNPVMDSIATAGGTGKARLATSQQDIEAALADIVASSVLVEKCNGKDDDCDGKCDEDYPGVGVTNPGSDGKSCSNAHSPATCDNGFPAASSCFNSGIFVCAADQLSQVCSAQICIGAAGGTLSSPAAGQMRITNAFNIPSSAVGKLFRVSGASKAANNGLFVVSAVGATTVDVANAAVNMPDPATVVYGFPSMQGAGNITRPVAGTERITLSSGTTGGVLVGDQITILNALPVADNGTFNVTNVTATFIEVANGAAVAGTAPGLWADLRICPGVETCNGKDDDCDGIIDNCGGGGSGSCCTSSCPPCAKSPFLEVCNNCDDDCDGTIDNNLTDTGATCDPNNTGDCAPSTWKCCSTDPSTGSCGAINGSSDALYCVGGNPGYPKLTDQCDGTDDNCNGVANDGPSPICFDDGSPGPALTPGQDGKGICHHGVQACQTTPLPAGDPGCPPGWPPAKVCPRMPPVVGPCTGLQKPLVELCNGRDDDCDMMIDNNLKDDWADPTNPNFPTANPCCSTGNPADCMNTGTGTRCHLGGYVCMGGVKKCANSVAKSLEICDNVDNDCNGPVDDVPGLNTPCTGNNVETRGECTARLECVLPNPVPQCVQKQMAVAETCNGKDDNCNGEIDDVHPPLAPPSGMLPGEGVACMIPMAPADKPPCKAGATVCVAGMFDCQGAVGPMPNQCNGVSTDCTGNPNSNGNCPTGFQCYQGNCVAPCQAGEFPCPGGYACQQSTMLCIPDECAKITCPAGFNCSLDAAGKATCVDPCLSVTCPPTYICKLGVCVDASCRTQGCPGGEICVTVGTNMFECQPDPCADVICPEGQFCSGGSCVGACIGPCPSGQFCDKGTCAPDPCAHVPCLAGQVCQVQPDGSGLCVENMCQFGCGFGQACCGGSCVADQCEHLHCPEDTHCSLTSACTATCETNPQSPKDQIVGAGGGGFGCAVGGEHERAPSAAWLMLVAVVLLYRRRPRSGVRR